MKYEVWVIEGPVTPIEWQLGSSILDSFSSGGSFLATDSSCQRLLCCLNAPDTYPPRDMVGILLGRPQSQKTTPWWSLWLQNPAKDVTSPGSTTLKESWVAKGQFCRDIASKNVLVRQVLIHCSSRLLGVSAREVPALGVCVCPDGGVSARWGHLLGGCLPEGVCPVGVCVHLPSVDRQTPVKATFPQLLLRTVNK